MKIAINACYGGFSISQEAVSRLKELSATTTEYPTMTRNDALLIQVIEELGPKANGRCAELKIVEIPDDVNWCIEEYDGMEWVAEAHRTWN